MRQPKEAHGNSTPGQTNTQKRGHPMDADEVRQPAMALTTPGAMKFKKSTAPGGLGHRAPTTPTTLLDSGNKKQKWTGASGSAHQGNANPTTNGTSAPKTHAAGTNANHTNGPSAPHTTPLAPPTRAQDRPTAIADEIEIIAGPLPARARRVVSLPGSNVTSLRRPASHVNLTQRRIPLGPKPAHLQAGAVSLERFLDVARIHNDDSGTRRLLCYHGIIQWTFFRSTSEDELLDLGFPIGTARLLCEGVALLEADVKSKK
ncbi:hypothetical protein PTTG_25092 [Puccinia triticina 1-1 BBBD Race 1]|uniref:SAM domain-containing protein n=2 Tax=Puccinia triticina TaxID=208348 RepID=A0A180H4K3_PUCT1|nr:uncharacterized protein PtA15_9A347 [Puccinia triticina]OAV99895.1 hypothetical protein PTTG_25092 [Puccinia triticina 1-1 BBBD Race 1]WAQ88220.1 hypothetical protein PtA15_9A347 [Puccinia triticina]WAR60407.1 hypothetical protein PtB15_9B346 [Puccinia triticina]